MNTQTNQTEIIPQSNLQIENTLEAIKRKNQTYDILQIENGITIITIHKAPFIDKNRYRPIMPSLNNKPFEHRPFMRYKDYAKTLKR